MDDKKYLAYLKTDEWREIARQRLVIDNYTCAMCGARGTPGNRLEVHHMTYKHLYREKDWVYQDLISLCHVCHKMIHTLMKRQTDPNGRHGWKDNQSVPQVSVYTIAGSELEYQEEGR